MRYGFIDLSFRIPLSRVEGMLNLLRDLRYAGIAQEGVERYLKLGSLSVFPRVSFKSGAVPSVRGNKLMILVASTQEEIKVTNAVRRGSIAVELNSRLLNRLSRKALGRLKALSIPILIKARDIYSSLLSGEAVAGLDIMLNEFVRGHLSIAVGSGAERTDELRHPITYVGLLIELGVPEALAIDAVFNQPKIIVRRAGYSA